MVAIPVTSRVSALFLLAAAACSAAPRGVEILWDKFGVAHVYAQSNEGLFFGYGYASMQSHGDLILKLYGESRGRAAEYWGAGERDANLVSDRWVVVNEVRERGENWYRRQTPEFRRHLDAFAAGMNEYAQRHPDKLDEARRKVLPITGADPVIHTHRIMHFSYVSSRARVEALATGRRQGPDSIGSNAWAIAPRKSASGKAMILMNPHLPWVDWYTYYEIHLNAPGVNLYGASQVGFPVLRFALSDRLAFTQTVNSSDGSDLYEITPDGDGYRFDGERLAFETSTKTIKILGRPDETLTIRKTVHGPVVWDRDGKVLALRTAGLDRPFGLEQYWKMATAPNFAAYEAQVKRLEVPTFNITYADRDGHVMYFYNAALPVRTAGDSTFWAGIVPGDRSETLWTKLHVYDDLPKVIDPPTGFVQNTNDPPWTSTWPASLRAADFPPYTSASRPELWRTVRSLRMLGDKEKLSFEDVLERKMSTRLELADRVLDDILARVAQSENPRAKQAAGVLKAWDRQTETASRGALLFETLMQRFGQGFATPFDPLRPFDTPAGVRYEPAVMARMLEEAAIETERNYGSIDAPWGEWRRLKRGGKEVAGNGATGGLGAFRVNSFAGANPKKYAVHGDTFVLIAEFTNPIRAVALVGYGNSTQPGSPHVEDQLDWMAAKKMRPVWRTRKEVEPNVESRDRF
jgi:acyl-homoserine-lactone acylase